MDDDNRDYRYIPAAPGYVLLMACWVPDENDPDAAPLCVEERPIVGWRVSPDSSEAKPIILGELFEEDESTTHGIMLPDGQIQFGNAMFNDRLKFAASAERHLAYSREWAEKKAAKKAARLAAAE